MRISLSWLIVLLALGGCDRSNPDVDKSEAAASTPAAVAPSPSSATNAEQPGELPLGDLAGIWRVTGVVPDKGSAFATDDPRIVSSLIDFLPDQIRWSYKASTGFASDDVCMGPVAGIIDDSDYADQARRLIAPSVASVRSSVTGLSRPHQWLCGEGGSWGNDTEFQRLADGKVAMRWTGEVTLILDRVRKVAANPSPLPPSGAYEE
jgi:hypothetical protein